MQFPPIKLLQMFAHATTAQLLCYVQNFVVISLSQFELELSKVTIGFNRKLLVK